MKNNIINNEQIKNAWNNWSDDYYKETNDIDIIKHTPHKVFPTRVWERICQHYQSLKGLKICIPSSGDNKATFAFHLLGADVTSCDISCNQIKNAIKIAENNNWNINFKVLDSMDLSSLENENFDLIYTSNGVHVWISDLPIMYSCFNRILKKGGRYIFFETHPFIHPFDDSNNELRIIQPYDTIKKLGDIPNYLWRIQDFANSLIQSRFTISSMDELFAEKDILSATWWDNSEWDEKCDININPYAALPQWISFCTIK